MDAHDVADWRRRVFALYAAVRGAADPQTGHALWRRGRDDLFGNHPAAPLLADERAGFAGLSVADYDPDWRFELAMERVPPEDWDVTTGTDGRVRFERYGVVEVPDVGSLDVWRLTSYGGGLFIPVKDRTAGKPGGSYGAGRYLVDTVKGADLGLGADSSAARRVLVLDFNFAYNPSCAYDPTWACPLAPPGNIVGADIPVGERAG
ncbi:MAG: DUF1684 domain-containing protein [Nocardioides sp.]